MIHKKSTSEQIFTVFNYTFLIACSMLALLPMIHMLAISLSSNQAVAAGQVSFWPVLPTLFSYRFILSTSQFVTSVGITAQRLILGIIVNMLLTVLVAYPLSKENKQFKMRTFFAWYFLITILFSGGLIPTYMIVRQTQLIDSIWALVLPSSVPVFHVIILLNFFRQIPKELEEASFIDGASHWDVLFRIFLPVSKPAIATLLLFTMVFHWNSWFDGLIYMNRPERYPLQSYLQTIINAPRSITIITSPQQLEFLLKVSERTGRSAQIFIAMLPILLVYPFLQKYFVKGIVLGSVKG